MTRSRYSLCQPLPILDSLALSSPSGVVKVQISKTPGVARRLVDVGAAVAKLHNRITCCYMSSFPCVLANAIAKKNPPSDANFNHRR